MRLGLAAARRRQWPFGFRHAGSICALTGLLLLFTAAATPGDDDSNARTANGWRMFRGNPQLTGVAAGTVPENPVVLWTFQATDAIESTAAIDKDRVYVGSLDGYLYALDFATGELRWKVKTSAAIKSSPTVYHDRVYFGDEEGVFRALNAATGDSLWRFVTEGEIISSANFFQDRILFGSYDNFLYCLSAREGTLLWKIESEGYLHATPAIFDNKVCVTGCDGFFRVVDIEKGREVKKVQLGDYVAASPAILDGHAFFGTFGNQVFCLSLQDSKVKWRYEHPKRKHPYYASAAVTGEVVIVGGRDKMVHALNPETGEPLWTFSTRSKIESSPVIVGNSVIFASTRGKITILDLRSGEAVWEYDSGASIAASISTAEGKFVIGNDDGVLTCFGEE